MAKQPQIDTATIQNKISEPLRKAIEPLLEQPATVFDDQITSLQALLENAELPDASVQSVKDSLHALEEARERANSDYLDSVRSNIATAVVAAVRELDKKVPLRVNHAVESAPLKSSSHEKPTANGRKSRMSRDQASALAGRVLDVMPTARSGDWISRSEIVEKSGVDNELLQSVLIKLKREGEAQSNGQRGAAGAWRRVE